MPFSSTPSDIHQQLKDCQRRTYAQGSTYNSCNSLWPFDQAGATTSAQYAFSYPDKAPASFRTSKLPTTANTTTLTEQSAKFPGTPPVAEFSGNTQDRQQRYEDRSTVVKEQQEKMRCCRPNSLTPFLESLVPLSSSCNMNNKQLEKFRTQICPRKSNHGSCWLEERCPFSHCLSWHRRNPMISGYRPSLCPNVMFCIGPNRKMRVKNHCHRGRLCLFSHTKEEQMYHPLVYKSQLCRDWPDCTKHFCPFAHGTAELRSGQDIQFALAEGPEKPEAAMALHQASLERSGWKTRRSASIAPSSRSTVEPFRSPASPVENASDSIVTTTTFPSNSSGGSSTDFKGHPAIVSHVAQHYTVQTQNELQQMQNNKAKIDAVGEQELPGFALQPSQHVPHTTFIFPATGPRASQASLDSFSHNSGHVVSSEPNNGTMTETLATDLLFNDSRHVSQPLFPSKDIKPTQSCFARPSHSASSFSETVSSEFPTPEPTEKSYDRADKDAMVTLEFLLDLLLNTHTPPTATVAAAAATVTSERDATALPFSSAAEGSATHCNLFALGQEKNPPVSPLWNDFSFLSMLYPSESSEHINPTVELDSEASAPSMSPLPYFRTPDHRPFALQETSSYLPTLSSAAPNLFMPSWKSEYAPTVFPKNVHSAFDCSTYLDTMKSALPRNIAPLQERTDTTQNLCYTSDYPFYRLDIDETTMAETEILSPLGSLSKRIQHTTASLAHCSSSLHPISAASSPSNASKRSYLLHHPTSVLAPELRQ